MAVRQAHYRRPPTAEGLRAIESNSLDWFSPELYANFNTGVLEEYLEERNRRDSFELCPWDWRAIALGIFIGIGFSAIQEYVALKVGIGISSATFVVYAVGLALKWRPTLNNNASGAAGASTSISSGFVFTYPAIWLLHAGSRYPRDVLADGTIVHWIPVVPPLATVIIATMLAGFMGTLYFILFRRIWLVDDPLPSPGFEASVQLLEIADQIHKGTPFNARRLITLIFGTAIFSGGYTLLKDAAFLGPGGDKSVFDLAAEGVGAGSYYSDGILHLPPDLQHYTNPQFGFSAIILAIGWFMRFRVAMLVSMGSFLTWFILIPMAVLNHTPVYDIQLHRFIAVDQSESILNATASQIAYGRIARYIAIGAILGGGMLALLKMYPVFVPALRDVQRALKGNARTDYVPGKGWYEWPLTHIWFMVIFATVMIPVLFITLGGFSVGPSIALGLILFSTTFAFGAIAVKVMGETGSEPVSGTTFLFLLMFIGVLVAIGTSPEETALIGLLGATVFGCAITMSGAIISDYKAGLYVGNRPYHLMRSTLTGIVPGAPVGAVAATFFSILMVTDKVEFLAPQANAFAGFTSTILGGPATSLLIQYIAFGAFIGVAAEYLTGMGTAFGLGMYFPLAFVTPGLVGAMLRDFFEIRYLEPRAKRENWTEKQYVLRVLDTFMIASGLIIGEAVVGVLVTAIYLSR